MHAPFVILAMTTVTVTKNNRLAKRAKAARASNRHTIHARAATGLRRRERHARATAPSACHAQEAGT